MSSSAFHLTSDELFDAIQTLAAALPATADAPVAVSVNRELHELLVQVCHEGTRDSQQAFGNLFAQVDYLCRVHHVAVPDRIAIQTLRRHSNRREALTAGNVRYDLRALALFVAAVFNIAIPSRVVAVIPPTNRPHERAEAIDYRYIRCIVRSWDEQTITATSEQAGGDILTIDYTAEHLRYLKDVLREGMQLNLIDCKGGLQPSLIIVEPDYLIDISAIAACFEPHGHHPLSYIVRRLAPAPQSQAILLGNLASQILDDTINGHTELNESIRKNFRRKALDFCTCPGFRPEQFISDAKLQARNIREAVGVLFDGVSIEGRRGWTPLQRKNAILEPSFVCESLGIQGRVDLMTTDLRLLVEQKSGKNYHIERHQNGPHGSLMLENHYVQLLLYYGVLQQNFHLTNFDQVDLRLLYSRFPAKDGLVVVNYLQRLFREAIRLRNLIVAWELHVARDGFESIIDLLRPDTFLTEPSAKDFFDRWKRPELERVCRPLQLLSPLERAYFCQMATFVFRELRVSRLGAQEGVTSAANDLWNMPLSEKEATGSILAGLDIVGRAKSDDEGGFDTITLAPSSICRSDCSLVENQEESKETVADAVVPPSLPNFRLGDPVFLYPYKAGVEPDLRHSILLKGTLTDIQADRYVVTLNDGQQNANVFSEGPYAIEHSQIDTSGSALRALHCFASAPKATRDLLLAQRTPQSAVVDTSVQPTAPSPLDDIVCRALHARDYFLLIGPPGTGKTSIALRQLVKTHLEIPQLSLLLTAYTNRAVDEICSMLVDAALPFVRLGGPHRSDPRFHPYLVENVVGKTPRLDQMKATLQAARIIVATTSTLQGHPEIFQLKQFQVAIVDEASQILEPDILGILARVPKFILIGDHKQLPAVVQQSEAESRVDDPRLLDICLTDCRNSLFERLLHIERKAGRSQFIGVLNRQGRMHPDIARFPSRTFYAREQLEAVPLPHQKETTTAPRVVFIPVRPEPSATSARANFAEAKIVAQQLKKTFEAYSDAFSPQKTVGVIVPYRNQIALIRQQIELLGIPALLDITIDTVERYQGSQRDVIIYSFTVSRLSQLEFLTATTFIDDDGTLVDRKLNVALTRARKMLILTGNPVILKRVELFRRLISDITENE